MRIASSVAIRAARVLLWAALPLAAAAPLHAQECRRGAGSTDTAFAAVALASRGGDPLDDARNALLGGRPDTARDLLVAIPAARLENPGQRARAWSLRALAHARSGEFAAARSAAGRVEAVEGVSPAEAAEAALVAGVALAEIADHDVAVVHLRRAASLAADSGEIRVRALAAVDLAALQAARGTGTLDTVSEARSAIAALPDPALRASLLLTLGNALAGSGAANDPAAAHSALLAAYADASAANRAAEAAQALGLIGVLQFSAGAREESARTLTRAVALSRAADGDVWSFRWHWMLGRAKRAAGDHAAAAILFARAVQLLEETKGRHSLGTAANARIAWREVYMDQADAGLRAAAAASDATARQAALVATRDALELSRAAEVEDFFNDPCIGSGGTRRIAGNLDAKAAVIYPVVLADRLEILVEHRTGLERFSVATTPAAMTAAVERLRSMLEKRSTRQYLTPARSLHAQLIAPIEPLLARLGVTTLVIVPDGVLRTVPFAALHDGKTFLVERYTLATTPAAALTQTHAVAPANIRALLTGLTEARQGFAPLPGVRGELEESAALLNAAIYRDSEFSLERLQSALSTLPINLLHIASHGQFSRDPAESFLLTFDGRLTLAQLRRAIASGKLREEPLELLVLSACHTASGDERAALGLAGVALASGARSALASLWAVSDESTSVLMTTFYKHLAKDGMTKAAALRQAQLDLAQDDRFSHPAYWGAFLMIGNWL